MPKQPEISNFFKSQQTSNFETYKSLNLQNELIEILDSNSDDNVNNESQTVNDLKEELNNVGDKIAEEEKIIIKPSKRLIDFKCPKSIELNSNFNKSRDFSIKLNQILKKRDYNLIFDESKSDYDDDMSKKLKSSCKKGKNNKLTDLDQQYKDLKLQNMDTILAVRVGYKYKFFAPDAIIVSQILQIKLVPGKMSLDDSQPGDLVHRKFSYCCIPDTRLEVHLKRLLHHNLKVAIVEQTETVTVKKLSGNSGSLFERKISNLFTKATYGINEVFNSDNYRLVDDSNTIWGLVSKEILSCRKFFLVSIQLSSGEIIYDEFEDNNKSNNELEMRIKHLNPIEIVSFEELSKPIKSIFYNFNSEVKFYLQEPNDQYSGALEHIITELKFSKYLQDIIIVLYQYLQGFGNERILTLKNNYTSFKLTNHMLLSSNTVFSLELLENSTDFGSKGSLIWFLDHTRTVFGFRKLKSWILRPLVDSSKINERLDAIQCLINEAEQHFLNLLNKLLKETQDIDRILNRITYGKTSRKEVYLFLKRLSLYASLFTDHQKYFKDHVFSDTGKISTQSKMLTNILQELYTYFESCKFPDLLSMINIDAALDINKIKSSVGFFNLNNYDNAEDILSKHNDIGLVKNQLYSELNFIRKVLKRPIMNYKDEKEFLIEVRNTQLNTIPSDWIKVSSTKMVSRFLTPTTKQLVEKLQYHEELLIQITEQHFNDFLKRIRSDYTNLKHCIDLLAVYDCLLSLAATSSNVGYTRPQFTNKSQFIKIKNGRNPIIEALGVNYVPNDVYMTPTKNKIMVITGPNMGGKSSYIRQVALLVILAQIGCFVPADFVEMSMFDRIFTRIGAYDNLISGESTFQVEMYEMVNIINSFTENSLLLLDEIGRGTGTHDGTSISYSILKYFLELKNKCPLILFITHYSSLGQIKSPLLEHFHMSYIEEKSGEVLPNVIFLYKLKYGKSNDSYGLNVAKLAKVPKDIINQAFYISENMKIESNNQYRKAAVLYALKSLMHNENDLEYQVDALEECLEQ